MRQFPERLTMKMVQRPFVCGYVTTHGRSGRTVRPCSGHKNRSSLEPAGTKIREGMVGLFEWIARGLSDNANLRRQAQEIDSILPCEIGDRQKLSLFPKDLVREAWDVAHMDAGTNDTTAFANRLQRQGHQIANGRKDDRSVERLRRHLVGTACPCRAEASSKTLGGDISRPREGEHRAPLPLRHLHHDMGRGTKAIKSHLFAIAGDHQRAPADQTGTEQGGKRRVAADLTERERESRISDRRRRVTAIARESREYRMIAQIFPMHHAIGTDAASVAEPRNAD